MVLYVVALLMVLVARQADGELENDVIACFVLTRGTAACLDACTVCTCTADTVDCSSQELTEVPCNFPATTVEMYAVV